MKNADDGVMNISTLHSDLFQSIGYCSINRMLKAYNLLLRYQDCTLIVKKAK